MKPDDELVIQMRAAAKAAMEKAYSPYSKFQVGAAVLTTGDEIFAGCNVENVSYGLTMCAERNAIFQAVAKGHRRVKAVVIVTDDEKLTPPCGACRQVINEFGPKAEIFIFGSGKKRKKTSLPKLLPHAFTVKNLPRGRK